MGQMLSGAQELHICMYECVCAYGVSWLCCGYIRVCVCAVGAIHSYLNGTMKAFSPVRSVRKSSLTEHSLGIARSKTPVDDPMSLLYNMNDCYSKLKELVPSIPQNKKVSKMEILQHVIDYILDLQHVPDPPDRPKHRHQHPVTAGKGHPKAVIPIAHLGLPIAHLGLPIAHLAYPLPT
uniref:DNA-binding protein inhibitor ID-4 n=1 Tax=Xenopus tropicalis TaxID=8364 RepID=A0A803JGK7_XENTR